MPTIVKLDTVYQGWGRLMLATVREDDGTEVRRQIEDHGHVAAVLPYDPERRVAALIRIARAPALYAGETRDLVEPVAGLIDRGEDAETAARREAMEEAGLRLGALDIVGRVFPSPGASSETMTLYLAAFTLADRTGAGGGADGEDEHLEAFERPLAGLWADVEAGAIADGKLLTLLLALKLRRPELF